MTEKRNDSITIGTVSTIRKSKDKIVPLTYSDTKLSKDELCKKYKDITNIKTVSRSILD